MTADGTAGAAGDRDAEFDPDTFAPDPLDQLRRWLADALRAGAREPSAMTPATDGGDGVPGRAGGRPTTYPVPSNSGPSMLPAKATWESGPPV